MLSLLIAEQTKDLTQLSPGDARTKAVDDPTMCFGTKDLTQIRNFMDSVRIFVKGVILCL